MTLNLKSVAFVPYVSLLLVICTVVLATFGHFLRRLIRKKPHVDLRTADKNPESLTQDKVCKNCLYSVTQYGLILLSRQFLRVCSDYSALPR